MDAGTGRIVGVFRTRAQAEAARAALVDEGIAEACIDLAPVTGRDGVGEEAPGQSFENQPGEPAEANAAARFGEAVRSGACTLTVDTRDAGQAARVMRMRGAMRTLRPPG